MAEHTMRTSTWNLDAAGSWRLSRDRRVDGHLKATARKVVAYVRDRYGDSGLKSVLLIGSAGRGEAVGILEGESCQFTSDLDFVLVFNTPGFFKWREDCHKSSRRLTEVAGNRVTEIELSPIAEISLKLVTPTIAYLDLSTSGRLVYGRKPALKHVQADMVGRLDALELLFNRISEFLENAAHPRGIEHSFYLWSKLAGDGIGAWLALKREFSPSYRERMLKIRRWEPEITSLLGNAFFQTTMDLLELRIDFSPLSVKRFSETRPHIGTREIGMLLQRISQVCLNECGIEVPGIQERYWEIYSERTPLYLWTPYLFTKVPSMVPFLVRTGVHPKAVLNYCLLLLLWHMVDGNSSHLTQAAALLDLLSQKPDPTYEKLIERVCFLCRNLNSLPLKPHTPWVFHL